MKVLGVDEARAAFAEVLATSQTEPVCITRHGKPIAVITGAQGQDIVDIINRLVSVEPLRDHVRGRRAADKRARGGRE